MVTEALRNYVSLASGLVEVSRQQAVRAARALSSPGEINQEQIGHLAEELLAMSRRNRDAVVHLIGHEMERARDRLGVAPAGQVGALEARIEALEAQVATLQGRLRTAPDAEAAASASTTARDVAAKKTAAKAAATNTQAGRTTRTAGAKSASRRPTGGTHE